MSKANKAIGGKDKKRAHGEKSIGIDMLIFQCFCLDGRLFVLVSSFS